MSRTSLREIRTGLTTARHKPFDVHNRRGEQRFRYAISVFLLNRANRFPAMTIDVSSTGARIKLDHPVLLDAECLFAAPSFGIVVPSVVVWRQGLELAVRFTAAQDATVHEVEAQSGFGRRRPTSIAWGDRSDPCVPRSRNRDRNAGHT